MNATRMPWGKHKGERLDAIPAAYLWWVLESCTNVDPLTRLAITQELTDRLPKKPAPAVQSPVTREYLVSWCRRAALACHPDRGGSVAAMKLVNELMEKL